MVENTAAASQMCGCFHVEAYRLAFGPACSTTETFRALFLQKSSILRMHLKKEYHKMFHVKHARFLKTKHARNKKTEKRREKRIQKSGILKR